MTCLRSGLPFCGRFIKTAPQSKNTVMCKYKTLADTSIKHHISGLSTFILKGCIYIMFDVLDTPFSYGRALILSQFLQEFSKAKESTLHVIQNASSRQFRC